MIINNNQNIHEAILSILSSLENQGTSESTLKNYRTSFHAFEAYLKQHGILYVSEEVCLDYLFSKTGIRPDGFYGYACSRKLNYHMKPLHLLLFYLQDGVFRSEPLKKYPPFSCPTEFVEEYNGFTIYLREKGLAKPTIDTNIRYTQKLLLYFKSVGIDSIESVTVGNINSYITSYKSNSLKYTGTVLYAIRSFFRFLFDNGWITEDIRLQFPAIRIPRSGDIPYAWGKDDILKLLNAIDRNDPSGKRDYAIYLLALRTGLRSGDIRNLRISDINWTEKKLCVVMGKTGQPLELPLLDDVGWAIIDYLRNGRPPTGSDHVFVRHRAPFTSLGGGGLDRALHRYMVKAGINADGKGPHGMHSLRSTFAKNMLEHGSALPVISQSLGHQDISTTSIYLRIDVEGLRKCALDPEEVAFHEGL